MSEPADSADLEVPVRVKRRGMFRILLMLLCLPVAGWGTMAGWLASPFGRQWVAARIQKELSLETHVGLVTLTPWHGVSIQALEVLQPVPLRAQLKEPLLRVDDLRVMPVWLAWWHGRYEWTSVEIHRPQLVLPVELLSLLPAQQEAPVVAATSPSAAPNASLPTPPLLAQGSHAGPMEMPAATKNAPEIGILPQERALAKPVVPVTPKEPIAQIPLLRSPTAWVKIFQGRVTVLRAAEGKVLGRAEGLSGNLPVAGREASAQFRCGAAQLGDWSWKDGMEVGLDWKFPVLTQRLKDFEMFGVKGRFSSRIGLVRGLPVQMAVEVMPQVLAGIELPRAGVIKAGEVQSRFAFRGFLPAPGTWQADWMAEMRGVEATMAGRKASFDHGSAMAVLRGGMLSCLDARLVGDDVSLLGNATLLADGRGAGILRIVASPETLAGLSGHLFAAGSEVGLVPLSTPQRAALDIEAFGVFPKFQLRASH